MAHICVHSSRLTAVNILCRDCRCLNDDDDAVGASIHGLYPNIWAVSEWFACVSDWGRLCRCRHRLGEIQNKKSCASAVGTTDSQMRGASWFVNSKKYT